MKLKIRIGVLLLALMMLFLTACGDSSGPSMSQIEERIRVLEGSWDLQDVDRYDAQDRADWVEEINEEYELDGSSTRLSGEILTAYELLWSLNLNHPPMPKRRKRYLKAFSENPGMTIS